MELALSSAYVMIFVDIAGCGCTSNVEEGVREEALETVGRHQLYEASQIPTTW